MIALIGFIMIALIVVLLLKGKMSPIVVLALIPTVAALVLDYNPKDVAGFIKEGIGTTTSNGILFIFSVIYFGVMSDTGMFDVIVNFLVKEDGFLWRMRRYWLWMMNWRFGWPLKLPLAGRGWRCGRRPVGRRLIRF